MSIRICNFPFHPKFALQPRAHISTRSTRVFARAENDSSQSKTSDQQQLNSPFFASLSVNFFLLRLKVQIFQVFVRYIPNRIVSAFVGIPGLDESYLPRWIGYGFGSLLLLNHFSASGPISESQLVN